PTGGTAGGAGGLTVGGRRCALARRSPRAKHRRGAAAFPGGGRGPLGVGGGAPGGGGRLGLGVGARRGEPIGPAPSVAQWAGPRRWWPQVRPTPRRTRRSPPARRGRRDRSGPRPSPAPAAWT